MSEVKIKNHTIKELVGNGRTGAVYKGTQDSLQRDVAIKLMNPKFLAHKLVVEEFLERSRAAASLAHPNIISIYNVDQDDDETIYYTMEFMAGGSLDDKLRSEGALPVSKAARLTLGVAKALDVGRRKDQVHGNLKTSKILFMDDGETFKLSGVGLLLGVLAKHSARNPTPFTAPEVIQSERPEDHRADIFALGGLLYAMVAGEEFFEGERDLWKASGSGLKLVRPSEIDSSLPRELDDLILKMMAFDPDQRFQEYEDLYDSIEEIIEIGKELESKPKKKKKKKKKKTVPSAESTAKKETTKSDPAPDEEPTEPKSPATKPTKKLGKLGTGKAAAISTAVKPTVRRTAAAAAQNQGLPIGSIILALWSLVLLCAVGYWFLFMKDGGEIGEETSGSSFVKLEVETTSVPRIVTAPAKPLKLAKLENAKDRVEEFMEFALDQVASRGNQSVRIAAGGVNRLFFKLYDQVKKETAEDFDQGKYFEALSKVVSLHDNHAETPKQKETAQFYFAVIVKQIDKKFASESRDIVSKVQDKQLGAAKIAYKEIGDRFGANRWKEKAQVRVELLNELEKLRTSDGSKDVAEAASAFKGLVKEAEDQAKQALARFDFVKAATAYESLTKDAPTDVLKRLVKAQYDSYKLQAEGFEHVAKNVTTDADNKGIKFSEGPLKNADVVGAKSDQLLLKIGGQIETAVRFIKIEPDKLQDTLRKFSLDPQAMAGLYVFCTENNLANPAEELLQLALEAGDDTFKESLGAFVKASSSLKDNGGLAGAVDRYVGGIEAQNLYRTAVTELALGQYSQAELKLAQIIKEFPDSEIANEAKKLVENSVEESDIKVDENDLVVEGESVEPRVTPGNSGGGNSGSKEISVDSTGLESADSLYEEAISLYKKAGPNMPNWITHNKAALEKLDEAIKLYIKAARSNPNSTKLENRIAEAQRIKYNLKKTQSIN
ncbi:MAG: serine/threonine-protein kinase [Planctomycetota bacterium]|nr:serine/threonine-protein kinase [Planctomycetota bacterium]